MLILVRHMASPIVAQVLVHMALLALGLHFRMHRLVQEVARVADGFVESGDELSMISLYSAKAHMSQSDVNPRP
jgi:hypothetical protein